MNGTENLEMGEGLLEGKGEVGFGFSSFLSSVKVLIAVLGIPFAIVGVMGLAYVWAYHLGPFSAIVNLHYGLFIVAFFFLAFLIDAIYFLEKSDRGKVALLKFGSMALFLMVVAVVILGLASDMPLNSGAPLSATWQGTYGNHTQNVTDTQATVLCNSLFMDMMEHTSLIGPGMGAVLVGMTWSYQGQILTDRRVKGTFLFLMGIALAWVLVIAVMGVILTKTVTYPPGA